METLQKTARKEFGLRVKKYRTTAGVTQKNMAVSIKKQQSFMPLVEAGDYSAGLDILLEIGAYFGLKFYQIADPGFTIPTKKELRDNIRKYAASKGFYPDYLDLITPNFAGNLDLYLDTDALKTAKTSAEIAEDYYVKYNERILPSKVTDILTRAPRKHRLIIEIRKAGKGNVYKLK